MVRVAAGNYILLVFNGLVVQWLLDLLLGLVWAWAFLNFLNDLNYLNFLNFLKGF